MSSLNFQIYTGPEIKTCTWLWKCCRQVETGEVNNSRNKLHQTTCTSINLWPSTRYKNNRRRVEQKARNSFHNFLTPDCLGRFLWREGTPHKFRDFAAVQLTVFLMYRAAKKSLYMVWWGLSLLLLTTSASICLQHSRNHVQGLFLSPVKCRLYDAMGNVDLLIQNWFHKKSKGRQCKGRRPRNFDFFSWSSTPIEWFSLSLSVFAYRC